MEIGIKTINYMSYMVVGNVMLVTTRLEGMRWDEKTSQVYLMGSGGKQYETGFNNKEMFLEYISKKSKK